MIKTIIITGGNINIQYMKQYFDENAANYIIVVDRGLEALDTLNIVPTHIIGDFDSVNKELLNKYSNIPMTTLEPEKDFTDTHMAFKLALELNSTEVYVFGGIGSRIDHTLGNIHSMKELLDNNIYCKLLDENNEIQLINKTTVIDKDETYKYISLLPFTDTVTGITLVGFKYSLNNYTMNSDASIGISNEQIDNKATIEVKEGILIIIKSKD